MTDFALIKLINSRSRAGAEAFYDQYARVLLLVIIRILPEKEKAQLALEQSFIAIWKQTANFEPQKERFLTFAIRIARQQATLISSK